MTIGIVLFAFLAARTIAGPDGNDDDIALRRANSAATCRWRLNSRSPNRYSTDNVFALHVSKITQALPNASTRRSLAAKVSPER